MEAEKKEKAIQRIYDEKRKKYGLPSLSDIQSEFRIPLSVLEPEDNMILFMIRSEISRRISSIVGDIEGIIAGYDRYCCNIERRVFTKEDKKELFETYRKLQLFYWSSRVAFDKGEEAIAKWIKDFFKSWKAEFKQDVLKYDSKMRDAWEEIRNYEAEVKYVG
jgi:hypothetical protein